MRCCMRASWLGHRFNQCCSAPETSPAGCRTTTRSRAPFELGAEKSRVVIHIFFAPHEKRPAVMHRLWRNGQWAHAITAYGLPPCLFNEQRVGVDFEH